MAQRMRSLGKPLAGRAVLDVMLGRR